MLMKERSFLAFSAAHVADERSRPEGLHYQPDFIGAKEEVALIDHIRALPPARSSSASTAAYPNRTA